MERSYEEAVANNGQNAARGISAYEGQKKRRIAIKGLSCCDKNETSEVTENTVRAMIRDGCKLSDVKVVEAVCKPSRGKLPQSKH